MNQRKNSDSQKIDPQEIKLDNLDAKESEDKEDNIEEKEMDMLEKEELYREMNIPSIKTEAKGNYSEFDKELKRVLGPLFEFIQNKDFRIPNTEFIDLAHAKFLKKYIAVIEKEYEFANGIFKKVNSLLTSINKTSCLKKDIPSKEEPQQLILNKLHTLLINEKAEISKKAKKIDKFDCTHLLENILDEAIDQCQRLIRGYSKTFD